MFPSLPISDLTTLDFVLLAGLLLAHPAFAYAKHRQEKRREAEGRPTPRLKRYLWTFVSLWLIAGLVAAAWALAGRSWAEVGLTISPDIYLFAAGGAAVLASAALVVHMVQVTRSEKSLDELARTLDAMGEVDKVIPRTPAERNAFRAVSVTAGITEEFVYRGFLIWALAHWLPVWAAALAALAVFVALHLYQESWNAIARVALAGLVFTLVAVLSGSLIPAMLLHAVVDLTSGEMTSAARRRADARPAAA